MCLPAQHLEKSVLEQVREQSKRESFCVKSKNEWTERIASEFTDRYQERKKKKKKRDQFNASKRGFSAGR